MNARLRTDCQTDRHAYVNCRCTIARCVDRRTETCAAIARAERLSGNEILPEIEQRNNLGRSARLARYERWSEHRTPNRTNISIHSQFDH
jgi:hypothetical protein